VNTDPKPAKKSLKKATKKDAIKKGTKKPLLTKASKVQAIKKLTTKKKQAPRKKTEESRAKKAASKRERESIQIKANLHQHKRRPVTLLLLRQKPDWPSQRSLGKQTESMASLQTKISRIISKRTHFRISTMDGT
jgi:hypothetical protein